ncbi:hypothetical protein PRIPAC_94798 [Pristionchus pacificus]|uniref:Uncharacterized protein n=1 Tax=Pristionchus pacificus TaxID=54126 RepID=A0A2A6BQL8_PRIPA|nr:hypothetical protein PRIPAC_94798 [Pristionchus pacificus]|eukprot:PDM68210.1 hypothetical protein PRIPAC_46254 [Pristionchus pacificus]
MATLDSIPAEIVERIIGDLPLNDRLSFRHKLELEVSHCLNDFMRPRLPQLERSDHCEIESLNVAKLSGCILISTSPLDVPIALHLVDCTDFAAKTWKRKSADTGKIECFLNFEFPPAREFVLFKEAKIGHLEMRKHLPLHVEDGNLQQLSSILTGCEIEKFTVVLDKKTVQNMKELPTFVSTHRVKHVEFSLEKTFIYDMVEPFLCAEELAKSLVAAGVREITFTGDKMFGRPLDGVPDVVRVESGYHPRFGHAKPPFAFDVLLIFYQAGLQTITVNLNALENQERAIKVEEWDAFLDKIVEICDKPLRLTLTLHNAIEDNYSSYWRNWRKVKVEWQSSSIPSPYRERVRDCQHIVVDFTPMSRLQVEPAQPS